MFSYRHAFHAGNHADVLKHLVLLTVLQYLLQKNTPLNYIDTHAGTGGYARRSREGQISGEAQEGIERVLTHALPSPQTLPAALQAYVEQIKQWGALYPGSPFLAGRLLRPQDNWHAFEMLAPDARQLQRNLLDYPLACPARVEVADGFLHLKKLLPPRSRRGLVLMDPSYEIKTDYASVVESLEEALERFATGVYIIWYPIVPRPEAHQLPRRLKRLAQAYGKNTLHVTLSLRGNTGSEGLLPAHRKLQASGVVVINPPFTLQGHLRQSLPLLAHWMGQERPAQWLVE